MKDSLVCYSVGALLYCPANNKSVFDSIINEKFGEKYSLALCLEDTIKDEYVNEAEDILVNLIAEIYTASKSKDFYMPMIFVRVRNPQQITNLTERFGESRCIITGYVLPKFDLQSADGFISAILEINNQYDKTFYMMPILESNTVINLLDRYNNLYKIKEKLDKVEEFVLNVRVGGNDLCHNFGFRRSSYETIHNIRPIGNLLADILTVFCMDYVVSGPVWEYYNGDNWYEGLINEVKADRLCGFVGKTVIHPNQIKAINEVYKVNRKDYEDANAIINWDKSSHSLVLGSTEKERMNEYKTHYNWAYKILMLAQAYGVED